MTPSSPPIGTPPCATSAKSSPISCAPSARTRWRSTAAASSTPRPPTSPASSSRAASARNNTDSNSRLCMAAAVAGYRTSLGSDGPPTCYDDIELADVILIIGSNMAEAHPVTFDRIKASKQGAAGADDRRRRSAADGDCRRRPTCTCRSRRAATSPCSTPWAGCCSTMAASIARFIGEHTSGFDEYRRLPARPGPGRADRRPPALERRPSNSWPA